MSKIRAKNSSPEMAVRRLVHRMGFRYRLHVSTLPGKPDLVLPRFSRIIEVRGCFWHQHPGCIDSHIPKSRTAYWRPKLRLNRERDARNERRLRSQGWKVLILWECEIADLSSVARRIRRFLC